MKNIDLFTESGDFVATVQIPVFKVGGDPAYIAWGQRMFLKGAKGDGDEGDYFEAFGVAAVNTVTTEK